MKPRITEILKEMAMNRNDRYVSVQAGLLAELLAIISEEQAQSAAKLEQETARLVEETVELRRLTRGLHSLTIAVALFAFVQIFIMLLEYCSKLHGSS